MHTLQCLLYKIVSGQFEITALMNEELEGMTDEEVSQVKCIRPKFVSQFVIMHPLLADNVVYASDFNTWAKEIKDEVQQRLFLSAELQLEDETAKIGLSDFPKK